jgi:hypothetical protein
MYEVTPSQDMYGGYSIPFSEGGLIPDTCMSCQTQKNDNYEWEVSEMCRKPYEDASYRCEENLGDFYSWYYDKITLGCDYLQSKVVSMTASGRSSSSNSTTLEIALFGENDETVRTVMLFAMAAILSAAVILCCCGTRKNRSRSDTFKVVPSNAMETVTKQMKQSVHSTAEQVIDLTRSTSNPVERSRGDEDNSVDQVDGAYQAMDDVQDDQESA